MGHTIKVELPDDIYDRLCRRAEQTGNTPEEFAARQLSDGVQGSGDDALLQLAGAVESELTDVAERHGHYIRQRLAEGLKPSAGT